MWRKIFLSNKQSHLIVLKSNANAKSLQNFSRQKRRKLLMLAGTMQLRSLCPMIIMIIILHRPLMVADIHDNANQIELLFSCRLIVEMLSWPMQLARAWKINECIIANRIFICNANTNTNTNSDTNTNASSILMARYCTQCNWQVHGRYTNCIVNNRDACPQTNGFCFAKWAQAKIIFRLAQMAPSACFFFSTCNCIDYKWIGEANWHQQQQQQQRRYQLTCKPKINFVVFLASKI